MRKVVLTDEGDGSATLVFSSDSDTPTKGADAIGFKIAISTLQTAIEKHLEGIDTSVIYPFENGKATS